MSLSLSLSLSRVSDDELLVRISSQLDTRSLTPQYDEEEESATAITDGRSLLLLLSLEGLKYDVFVLLPVLLLLLVVLVVLWLLL